jgi:hypothetical protein
MTSPLDKNALQKAAIALASHTPVGKMNQAIDMAEVTITAYLAALATPSTGAVGEVRDLDLLLNFLRLRAKGRGHLSKQDADRLIEPLLDAMIALSAPPSSPSERDAALEDMRKALANIVALDCAVQEGSSNAPVIWWGKSAHVANSVLKLPREEVLALVRLKASRSDTVGPEAGK